MVQAQAAASAAIPNDDDLPPPGLMPHTREEGGLSGPGGRGEDEGGRPPPYLGVLASGTQGGSRGSEIGVILPGEDHDHAGEANSHGVGGAAGPPPYVDL